MDPKNFYQVFKVLSEIFDDKLSKEATAIYYQLLKQYPIEELQAAAMNILQTYKYNCMPKPAEFIDAIYEIRQKKLIEKDDAIKKLYQNPSEEDLKKINDLVQAVADKCSAE
tara:strand:+ start:227 stop:562 length:336 start_codon:yes stop_codon:yes gene_type:complete